MQSQKRKANIFHPIQDGEKQAPSISFYPISFRIIPFCHTGVTMELPNLGHMIISAIQFLSID